MVRPHLNILHACISFSYEEEIQLRESFYATHGPHLPDDLCYCVANMPTKWDVGPALGEVPEELPEVDEDLLVEVMVLLLCTMLCLRFVLF